MKCENSNRTLRQLLPDAVPEPLDFTPKKVHVVSAAVQTEDDRILVSSMVQTKEEGKPLACHRNIQTIEEEKPFACHRDIQTECELYCSDASNFSSHENLENLYIYEKSVKTDKNYKRCAQSPNNEVNKKFCLENSEENGKIAHEEDSASVAQQTTAYILLEDSNLSQEPDAINSECEEYEYFEAEVEEYHDETKDEIYEIDYSNEHFKTDSVYEVGSSDAKIKSDEEAEAIIKPKNNSKSKPKGQYKCSHCIMTFVSIKVLKRHLANRHDIKDADLVVDYLPASETDELLEDTSDSTTKLTTTKVELLPENVAKPQLMPREKTTASNDEVSTNVNYFCDHCQAGFAHRKTLSYHMRHQVCLTSNFKKETNSSNNGEQLVEVVIEEVC
ncbi:hypothetical protein EVAR_69765_1 [Eumeta japonica]|uniref:C2H2-type domain-containing protein n=1 Tax=Eumeta variegata TaxID=151549 RepID=A0A4C1T0A3_EUMVA|nr:hypothetical protein EVAR_69765_1 [Eumeta japonica]